MNNQTIESNLALYEKIRLNNEHRINFSQTEKAVRRIAYECK
jgi:hypothetical protein